MKPELTAEQKARRAEFDAIFEAMPGKNIERLRAVATALRCEVNTVRGWRLSEPHRVISQKRLALLKQLMGK